MINTILISAIVNNSKKHEQATSMGFFQAIYALGMFLGPVLSGNVANAFGINFVFYFSGLLMLITPLITGLKEISKENK
jgi:MFS family permease